MPRKLAAGNWKMNGTEAALAELATLASAHPDPQVDVLICPPATLLHRAANHGKIATGGQDCHANTSGAHTGDRTRGRRNLGPDDSAAHRLGPCQCHGHKHRHRL